MKNTYGWYFEYKGNEDCGAASTNGAELWLLNEWMIDGGLEIIR